MLRTGIEFQDPCQRCAFLFVIRVSWCTHSFVYNRSSSFNPFYVKFFVHELNGRNPFICNDDRISHLPLFIMLDYTNMHDVHLTQVAANVLSENDDWNVIIIISSLSEWLQCRIFIIGECNLPIENGRASNASTALCGNVECRPQRWNRPHNGHGHRHRWIYVRT